MMRYLCKLPVFVVLALSLSGCVATVPFASRQARAPVDVLLYKQAPRNDALRRLVVPVVLNGQGPFYFLLDTGATRSVLSRAVADQLGLVMNDRSFDVAVRGVNGRMRVSTTRLDSLRVGELELRELSLPVLGTSMLEGLDGILSMAALSDVRLTADFANAEVRISDVGGGFVGANPVKFSTVSRNFIVVDAWLGKRKVQAVIDTGGAHTLGNQALLNQLISDAGGKLMVRKSSVTDATDTAHDAWDAAVNSIRIGATELDDLTVSFGNFSVFNAWGLDDRPALLIGADALSRMQSVSIDYRRRELVLVAGAAVTARDSADQSSQHK